MPEFTRSDALDLNEKYCVRLLIRAVRGGARPDDCARSAAGIHLRDRTCRAEALLRILRQRSSPEAFAVDDEGNVAGHPALAKEIDEYARDLLAGESASGGATLVGSLVEILRKPAPGSYPSFGVSHPTSAHNPNPAVPGSIPPGAGTAPSFIQTPGGTATTPGGGAFAGFGASSQPANPLSLAPAQQQPFGGGGIFGAQPTQQQTTQGVQAQQQPTQPGAVVVAYGRNGRDDPFAASALLELVEDERGRLCRRAEWLSNERRLVAECLYHAIVATGVRSGDVPTDTPGGALSASDAKAVMELFAEVATPTVARACADAHARSLDAGRAQGAAAQVAAVGALDEYSGVPGSSPPTIGDLPQSVQEDLPAAIVVALAAVAAVVPAIAGSDGAKSHAQVVETASAALQKAVDDANERAGVAAPVKIDPLRALGDYPFLNASERGQRDGQFGFDGQPAWRSRQQQQHAGAAYGYGSPFAVPGQAQTPAPGMIGPDAGGQVGQVSDKSADEEEEERVAQMTIGVLEFCRLACALTGLDLGRKDADVSASVAADAGALTAARAMLRTCAFQDDADASRRHYLDLVHAVIRRAIAHMLKNPAIGEALAAVVPAPTLQQVERERVAQEHWESNSLFETDAELQRQREEEEERLRLQREEEDASREAPLTALCGLLREVYSQAPHLPAAAADVLPAFLDAIVEWEHSVESLVAVVGLAAAVAGTGPEGASQIWSRMRHPPPGSCVTWDSFVGALVGYNRRFRFGGDTPRELEENERSAGVEAGGGYGGYGGYGARGGYGSSHGNVGPNPYAAAFSREREMPEADVQGLSAYLGLLASLLRAAPPGEAPAWTQWLEGRYGFSLLDELAALHSCPVPAKLKAAILDAIAATGRGSARAAADAWRRLEREAAERGAIGSSSSSNPALTNFADFRSPNFADGSPYGRTDPHNVGLAPAVSPNGLTGYGAAAAARQQHSYYAQMLREASRAATLQNQLCVPGSDVNWEFMHGEARSRTYPHASAYVRMVNGLIAETMAQGAGPSAGSGRGCVGAFRFVRDCVFGNLRHRQHRSQTERWSLARDAAEHFRLQLELFARAPEEDKYVRGWSGWVNDRPDFDPTLHGSYGSYGSTGGSPYGAGRSVGAGNHLAGMETGGGGLGDFVDPQSSDAYAPGRDLMVDFLSDGVTFRGILAVLSVGADYLAAERPCAHGEALEGCVLACLECVAAALAMDKSCVDALRERAVGRAADQTNGRGFDTDDSLGAFHSSLDQVMLRDASQCAAAIGYVSYRHNPALALASLKIFAELAERTPRLVDLLPRDARAGLVEGCASVLELATLVPRATTTTFGDAGAAAADVVSRAGSLVLDVLLENLSAPAPGVAHLLLGFDVDGETERSVLRPFDGKFNCLTVLLEVMEAYPPGVVAARGGGGSGGGALEPPGGDSHGETGAGHCEAPELAARLVFELAANEVTSAPTIGLLQNWRSRSAAGNWLPTLLADALATVPPTEDAGFEPGTSGRAASAHYRSWIMRTAALALDATAPPPGSFPAASVDDLPPLAAQLTRVVLSLGDGDDVSLGGFGNISSGNSVERPRMAALELLATLPPPPTPPLAAARECARRCRMNPEVAATQRELGVLDLLSDRRPFDAGGVLEVTARGDAVIGVRALGARLSEASRRVSMSQAARGTAGNGGGGGFGSGLDPDADLSRENVRKEAVQTAVRMARAFNASVEEHAAHVHAVSAWSELVAVCASRCLPSGQTHDANLESGFSSTGGPGFDAQEILCRLGDGVLAQLARDTLADRRRVAEQSDGDGGDGGADWWDARRAPLARLAATLMARLRASARGGGVGGVGELRSTADADAIGGGPPGAGISTVARSVLGGLGDLELPPLPATRCKALLRALLAALLKPRTNSFGAGGTSFGYVPSPGGGSFGGGSDSPGDPEVRANLYAALLSFLRYVRPARAAQLPGSVLNAARQQSGEAGAEAARTVDRALNAAAEQNELEASTSALIRRDAGPLVELIARDVVDSSEGFDERLRAAATSAVEALVAATVVASRAASSSGTRPEPSHVSGARETAPGTPAGGVGSAFRAGAVSGNASAFATSEAFFSGNAASPNVSSDQIHQGAPDPAAIPQLDPVVGALGQALARSGIVRACLARLERASLPDLILPTPAAAQKIASLRADVSLLLRLAQLPGGGARALASAGAMAALTNCRAIDAYVADGPGDAAAVAADSRATNGGHFPTRSFGEFDALSGSFDFPDENANPNASESFSLIDQPFPGSFGRNPVVGDPYSPIAPLPLPRARHHAVLVPVLRLAGTLVNALADDAEVHASGVAFLEAHRSVISRILSDRVRHAHLSDLAELEAAVTLVARLATNRRSPPGDDSPASKIVDEFVPALDALTARLIAGDGKYDAFIAAASPEGSPSASTSHAEIARRLASERARRKFGGAPIGGSHPTTYHMGDGGSLGGRGGSLGGSLDESNGGATCGLPPVPAAAAAARIERSHRAVRAALVSTQLALAEQGRCERFAALEVRTDLAADASPRPRPTLAGFAHLVARLSEELVAETRQRARILRRLAADGGAGAARAVAADAHGGFVGGGELAAAAAVMAAQNGGAFPHSGAAEASAAAAAVAARERAVRVLSHTCASSLELILGRLWAPQTRQTSGGGEGGATRAAETFSSPAARSAGGGFGSSDSPHLGVGFGGGGVGGAFRDQQTSAGTRTVVGVGGYAPAEIAELSAILAPAVAALADLDLSTSDLHVGDAGGFGDGGRLKGLIRRTRDTLLAAVPANAGEPPTLLLARGENHGGASGGGGGWGGGHDRVSPARGFAQSPLPPPRFGLFNA